MHRLAAGGAPGTQLRATTPEHAAGLGRAVADWSVIVAVVSPDGDVRALRRCVFPRKAGTAELKAAITHAVRDALGRRDTHHPGAE